MLRNILKTVVFTEILAVALLGPVLYVSAPALIPVVFFLLVVALVMIALTSFIRWVNPYLLAALVMAIVAGTMSLLFFTLISMPSFNGAGAVLIWIVVACLGAFSGGFALARANIWVNSLE